MAVLPSTSPSPPSPPSPASRPISNSRVTVSASIPSHEHKQLIHLFLILLLFLAALPSHSSSADISYADFCGSIVSEPTPSAVPSDSEGSFRISSGYFIGGDPFLRQDSSIDFSVPRSFTFYSRSVLHTQTPGTLQIAGTLIFRGGGIHFSHRNLTSRGRSLRLVHPWIPRTFNRRGSLRFDLSGFWSEETGKLCMVGAGTGRSKKGSNLNLSAVFKLKYPSISNITSSVVIGNLESLESVGSPNYFSPITLQAYAQRNYEYTKVPLAQSSCSALHDPVDQSIQFLDLSKSICDASSSLLQTMLKLEHRRSGCPDQTCAPLSNSLGFQPEFLKFNSIDCDEDGRFRALISLSNHSGLLPMMMLEPGTSMVAEGAWDHTKNQLCLLACRIKTVTDSLTDNPVDECTVAITLAFPTVLTIERSSSAVGRIWSILNETSPRYFAAVPFHSFGYNREYDHGLRYKYTKMDSVRKSCIHNDDDKYSKKRYPDPRNYRDFMFYLLIRTAGGNQGSGFANPIALGETLYHYPSMDLPELTAKDERVWNISYNFRHPYNLNPSSPSSEAQDTSAEGIYNTKTGMICMVGCRSSSSFVKQGNYFESKDCNILINIQIPPLNSAPGENLNGTIRSTRDKADPLFFDPLEISSHVMYRGQAAQSIWRTDVEIIMVLISLTFSCIFAGFQLLHARKHPGVLPSISITMLVVLTLGHMIILVLNFEAFFGNHKKQNVLPGGGGGWPEANEVVVRLMTMAAFLLHFRLLQVTWSARSVDEMRTSLWLAERKTIKLCLVIYIAGGFLAWFVHLRPHKVLHHVPHIIAEAPHSHWEDMQSFAGLILDGFLFPQLILNLICDSKERSLALPFYVGTTILRVLPHAYDAYRSSHYVPHLDSSYIYARPNGDLYSLAWDIIIPCGGVLFAVIIYIQQRFSGRSIFCRRTKSTGMYEMVPVSSS